MVYQAIMPRGVEVLMSALGPYALLGLIAHTIILILLVKSARTKSGYYEVVREEGYTRTLRVFLPVAIALKPACDAVEFIVLSTGQRKMLRGVEEVVGVGLGSADVVVRCLRGPLFLEDI
jgi:hypothetical protein